MSGLADKVAWITGGGTGLGKAMALESARQGARVAVSGRREDRRRQVVTAIEAAGGEALAVPCDVTSEDSLATAVASVLGRFGRLDVAIANAGFGVGGRFETLPVSAWRRQFEVNLLGAVATARAALPELKKTGGRLALVGSVASVMPYPTGSAYSASKAAIGSLGNTLYVELRGSGVSCTTLHPGFVESEIAQVDNSGAFHEDWVDRRPAWLMWRSDRAARVMLRAIERRRRCRVFTGHGVFAAALVRLCPGLVFWLVARLSARGGRA